MKKTLVTFLVMSLLILTLTPVANADVNVTNPLKKPMQTGIIIGTAQGAILAPVGLGPIGFMVGYVVGNTVSTINQHAQQ